MEHKTRTKALSWLLSLALMLSLIPGMSIPAFAADATELTTETTTWVNGDYVVPADGVTISGHITVKGIVNLTLTEGATLTANMGITLGQNARLNVSGKGAMVVKGSNGNTNSTVAGTGKLVLKSGTLTATGGNGQSFSSGNETTGNTGGVAINGTVIVNSGTLVATGGNGGSLNAHTISQLNGGTGGAAIGGAVTINGGTVTATGGNGGSITITNYGDSNKGGNGGAAIGGAVTINGGTLTATKGDNGTLNIKNGSPNYAGTGSAGYAGTLTLGANVKLYEGTNNTGTVLDDNDSDSRVYSGEKKANMYAYGSDVDAVADKSELNDAITVAEKWYDRIKNNTDYTDIASALKTAIDTAKAVADNDEAGQDVVDTATQNLITAILSAEASISMGTTWEEETYVVPIFGETIAGHITVTGTVNLILTKGATLTVNAGITLNDGATLNVSGDGAMVINGTNGNANSTVAGTGELILKSGTLTANGGNGGSIGNDGYQSTSGAGGAAINGAVTVKGGTLTAIGGTGGSIGNYGYQCTSGAGGAAINGAVTVNGGTLTATDGAKGTGGRTYGCTFGAGGAGYSGTLTLGVNVKLYEGTEANDEKLLDGDDGARRVYEGEKKAKMFAVGPEHVHEHNFTSYTVNTAGDTITATCSADGCTLPPSSEGGTDHVATLTIAPSSKGGNTAELTGDKDEFDLSSVAITYQKKGSSGWENSAAPGNNDTGFYRASATIVENETISVEYGVSVITKGTGDGNGCSFLVPKVAGVGAKIKPTLTLATGYEVKKITVKDENGNDKSTAVSADTEGFLMPDYNITVDVAFGMIDYTITKNDTTNGTFTVKKGENEVTAANYGDTVTLIAVPDTGFSLKSLSYKPGEGQAVAVTGEGNTRTFTMPASDIAVSAEFEGDPFGVTTSVSPATGGTVSVSGAGVVTTDNVTTAKAGSEVTLSVTPAAGFGLISDSVAVTKTQGSSAVELTKVSDTSYTFIMPIEAVTVGATFELKDVPISLKVTGSGGTTCKAELLNADYSAITAKKAGEQFILSVTADEDYDYTVQFNNDQDAANDAMKVFTGGEYQAYATYLKNHNLEVPAQTDLFRVTMPAVANDKTNLPISVSFAEIKAFTVLYKPTESAESVWCKFTDSESKVYVAQMKNTLKSGGEKVWSVSLKSAFDPTGVAFFTPAENLSDDAFKTLVNTTTTAPITGFDTWINNQYMVIGGSAKAVVAVFADALNKTEQFELAIVTENNGTLTAGSVTAPAASTMEGYTFKGWRGFVYDAGGKSSEQIYQPNDSIPIRANTTFSAVWEPVKLTVKLNPNNGEDAINQKPNYGDTIMQPDVAEKVGFILENWKVGKNVTESGKPFPKGSAFDFATGITENLELNASWKHVHSYTCVPIDYSGFGNALEKYYNYRPYLHIEFCGCADVHIVAHTFNEKGLCTGCGYTKPNATEVKLDVSYWKNGAQSAWMSELPRTVKRNEEVTVDAFWKIGDYQFSKWEYSTDNGTTWAELAAATTVGFIIPCSMQVRAIYVNTVTQPQLSLSARSYETEAQGYLWDSVLFQMNYKLPDGYTLVDAGVRMGDNDGISYYEMKEVKQSTGQKAAMAGVKLGLNMIPFVGGGLTGFATDMTMDALSDPEYYYAKRENSVLDELTAEKLAEYMLKFKPVNVEKYPPIYWETKVQTKNRTGSVNTLTPLRFIQKNNGNHYIYGMAYLTYKDGDGKQRTIYTDAVPVTNKNPNGNTTTTHTLGDK